MGTLFPRWLYFFAFFAFNGLWLYCAAESWIDYLLLQAKALGQLRPMSVWFLRLRILLCCSVFVMVFIGTIALLLVELQSAAWFEITIFAQLLLYFWTWALAPGDIYDKKMSCAVL
eukprot:TRINITY_DN12287_c0_g1_i1.p2 TRINITY_DN12287_c0_g1~~TRINITY_DN12287_c0_g1_i1.p2  ORF type:complete len:116 (+),score=17.91 TRINITY_DN12287_c0_g1_i1:576-923(+)